MTRTAFMVLFLAAASTAAEKLTLTLADGKKKTLTIESFDEKGLAVVSGGEKRRMAWSEFHPESAYRARKALTPWEDGKARLALAEFAARLKLYAPALEQLEIALALDGIGEGAFEKRASEIEAEEVAFLCGKIDALLASKEEPEACLAAIKRLKERYPDHANNRRYEPHIDALVERLAKEIEKQQDEEKKAEEDADLAALRKAYGRVYAKKAKAMEKAEKLFQESKPAIEKRQVSRVKKKLVEPAGAEKYYKRARKYLRQMARLDQQFRIVAKAELLKEYDAIEKRLIECYLGVARIQMSQRNYKATVEYLRKILYYDPIHEEALEMVEEVRRNRIHFKASDITNARPLVRGG